MISTEELKKKIEELEIQIKEHRKAHKLDEESTSAYTKMMKDPVELRTILSYWKSQLHERNK